MIPVSMVVYWMMILWLKEGDTCVNGGLLNDDILIKTKWYLLLNDVLKQWYLCQCLLNDDILIKTKWYLEIKTKWYLTNVSIVVYWLMIFWLKEGDTCVNGGLLNDDILIKTKWYLCQWWFIEWWYFE